MSANFPTAARFGGTTSLAVGSGAGASTAVFGTATFTIRVANEGPAAARYIVGDSPSVVSTVIANTGAVLPANWAEYITVSPGQRIAVATVGTASAAGVTVTEVS